MLEVFKLYNVFFNNQGGLGDSFLHLRTDVNSHGYNQTFNKKNPDCSQNCKRETRGRGAKHCYIK